jgi:Ca2+-binding RTX toxin-like protein
MADVFGTFNNDQVSTSGISPGVSGKTTNGPDNVFMLEGDDIVKAGGGNDYVFGDAGNDELHGEKGNDTLDGWTGNDDLFGGDGNDFLLGFDGKDTLDGGVGNDTLLGENGNDDLEGGDGKDILDGGVGNDSLEGGAGKDTFVYDINSGGKDTIVDFNSAADQIDLNGLLTSSDLFDTAASGGDISLIDDGDVNPNAQQIVVNSINGNTDLEIDFGNGNVLTLLGISSLTHGAGDDIFV